MQQLGFLDCQTRLERIDTAGDPLARPDGDINRERFRPILEQARKKTRKSPAGAKGCDLIVLVKAPILQWLCTLPDQALEFQIPDRSSFSRFLGLRAASEVPDATAIWRFREALSRGQVTQGPFKTFDQQPESRDFRASKGQIADAGIVPVPKALGSRRENERIRAGEEPEGWSEARRRQKDVDARWIGKNGKSCFGYENHIGVDVPHELIGKYQVSSAEVHDSQVFEDLSGANTGRDLRADSACRSAERLEWLDKRTRSRIHSRVEHISGVQAQRAGGLLLRCIGLVRARVQLGLRNLDIRIGGLGQRDRLHAGWKWWPALDSCPMPATKMTAKPASRLSSDPSR